METWRLVAAALLVASGLVLTLLMMAKERERHGANAGTVAVVGAITLAVLGVLSVLVITVLPGWMVWTAVVVTGVTVSVMMLAS